MSYSPKDYYEVRRVSDTPSDRKCVMLANGQPAWRDSRGRLWNASGREIDRCGQPKREN